MLSGARLVLAATPLTRLLSRGAISPTEYASAIVFGADLELASGAALRSLDLSALRVDGGGKASGNAALDAARRLKAARDAVGTEAYAAVQRLLTATAPLSRADVTESAAALRALAAHFGGAA